MRLACLGSGSRGNAILVEAEGTRILVDAGFSGRQLARRLEALEVEPESILAVVVTHEHRDHTRGAGVAARRWGWPLHMTGPTAAACRPLLDGTERILPLKPGSPLRFGDLEVRAFETCHDAARPVAVTVADRGTGLEAGIATDLGRATVEVRHALGACDFLVLEANHDEVLLREGPYPWSIKRRIGGSRGHLSNRLAGELAGELAHPGLAGVLLAHLSRECNDAGRALEAVGTALEARGYRGALEVAGQDRPTPLLRLDELAARLEGPQLDLFR